MDPYYIHTTTYYYYVYLFIYAKVLQFVCVCVSLIQLLRFDLMLSKLLSSPRNVHSAQRDYSITCVFVENHNKSFENDSLFIVLILQSRSKM